MEGVFGVMAGTYSGSFCRGDEGFRSVLGQQGHQGVQGDVRVLNIDPSAIQRS